MEIAAAHRTRLKVEDLGAQGVAFASGAADFAGCPNTDKVLPGQAGVTPGGANILDSQGPARYAGQRQARPQYLAPAFAFASIYNNRLHLFPSFKPNVTPPPCPHAPAGDSCPYVTG